MLYTRRTFTCPASSGSSTSQKDWDRAFLSPSEFCTKYPEEFKDFANFSTVKVGALREKLRADGTNSN